MQVKYVDVDSFCQRSRWGWHNWFSVAKDADWEVLEMWCNRCDGRTLVTDKHYTEYLDARRYYASSGRRRP